MEDNFLPGKTIRGMRVYRFAGCGGCPVHNCTKTLSESVVTLRHTGDERWDNWGRIVRVFEQGDVVDVRIKHDQSVVYCGTAGSSLHPGVCDFVDLRNFEDAQRP